MYSTRAFRPFTRSYQWPHSIFMPPPIVGNSDEVYCFRCRQQIFSFDGCVIYYLKCLVIHQRIRLNDLYKLMKSFFSNFEFIFEYSVENGIFFKRIEAWLLIQLQGVIKLYQWICLNKLCKLMESFYLISNCFLKFWTKTEIFSKEYRFVNIG